MNLIDRIICFFLERAWGSLKTYDFAYKLAEQMFRTQNS